MTLNVTDADACADTLQRIASDHGAISILVNNAGITRDNLFMRMKDDEWNDVIETDLTSVYRLCRLVVKPMVKARTSAAKAGLFGLTKSLARELGSRNITVNAIAPGFIESDMTGELPEQQKAKLHRRSCVFPRIPGSSLYHR